MTLLKDTRLVPYFVRTNDQAGHCALVPDDLPPSLAPRGPCLCRDCKSLTPRKGSAWHPSHVLSTSHTEDWRRLSYALGDAAADWVCGWVDQQPDPTPAMDAVLTIAEAPVNDLIIDGDHPRRRVWRYLEAIT